ncbi:hypothetical protein MUK42_03425 [Musa troglodytarum]|uniref:BHLH domain-containing protein n=1 Tax=Musa troglodytarum TaxID=320322 RepID=A0A9E7KXM1_9LILI|nr:hypothetical protein MUK42_03425 [Musa troglodytarum]
MALNKAAVGGNLGHAEDRVVSLVVEFDGPGYWDTESYERTQLLNYFSYLELGGLHEQNKNVLIEEMKAPEEQLRCENRVLSNRLIPDFTERSTAKFSCYMMNPFDATTSRDDSGAQMQKKNKIDMMEAVRIASLSTDYGSKNGSLMKEQKDMHHQPNLAGVHQEDPSNLATAAGNSSSTTRRRPNVISQQAQVSCQIPMEMEEDHEPKMERNSLTVATVNPKRKQVKDITESDLVHVRARHGQATSNHSLAERVRREKINERMKLLQGLVTGKAVMLDEIINYVQSLQQQVEFLSMKLAAINPRLDIDREEVLPKYLLQPCNSPSAAAGFSSDIIHPHLHLPQQGLIQSGLSGTRNPPDLLGRSIDTQMTAVDGYNMQVSNAWDEELHNVVQMRCSSTTNLCTHRIQQ